MSGPFDDLPDLASRLLGGSVPWANDELFAARDNLIEPHEPEFHPKTFGTRGQVYDGWETRRGATPATTRRSSGSASPASSSRSTSTPATSSANYPPEASVEGCAVPGYPNLDVVQAADWRELVPRSLIDGNSHNRVLVSATLTLTTTTPSPANSSPRAPQDLPRRRRRPAARARHPDHRPAHRRRGPFDLAASRTADSSPAPQRLLLSATTSSSRPRTHDGRGLGDLTAPRRRSRLGRVRPRRDRPREAHRGRRLALRRQRPRRCMIEGRHGEDGPWIPVLDRTPVQPNIRHRFPVADAGPLTHLRLNVYPDGGLARFRAFGTPTPRPAPPSAAASPPPSPSTWPTTSSEPEGAQRDRSSLRAEGPSHPRSTPPALRRNPEPHASAHRRGPILPRFDEILTPEALELIATLDAKYKPRRDALLAKRRPAARRSPPPARSTSIRRPWACGRATG